MQLLKCRGTAAVRETILILDRNGDVLATTITDDAGNWSVEATIAEDIGWVQPISAATDQRAQCSFLGFSSLAPPIKHGKRKMIYGVE